ARRPLELLERAPLLVGQVARDEHVDEHPVVATPEALQHGHSLPMQHDDRSGLRPRVERELGLAVERRQLDGRAERGLRHRQVDSREDVVALPDEARFGPNAHLDVDVAGAAAGTRMAAARQADPLAVVDPGRDLDGERALLDDAARAPAVAARLLDPPAGAAALGAALGADELPEEAARDLLQPSGAAARRARRDLAAGFGARATAARALDRHVVGDLARHAAGGLHELDLDLCGNVGTAAAAATRASEEIVAEERGEQVGEAAEVDAAGREAAAPQAGVAVAVVELAGLGLRKHLVGLDDLPEALLRVRRVGDVWMELARERAEGLLDLGLARVPRDPEKLVVVALGRRHRPRRVARRSV